MNLNEEEELFLAFQNEFDERGELSLDFVDSMVDRCDDDEALNRAQNRAVRYISSTLGKKITMRQNARRMVAQVDRLLESNRNSLKFMTPAANLSRNAPGRIHESGSIPVSISQYKQPQTRNELTSSASYGSSIKSTQDRLADENNRKVIGIMVEFAREISDDSGF